jgi:hypothetical protein
MARKPVEERTGVERLPLMVGYRKYKEIGSQGPHHRQHQELRCDVASRTRTAKAAHTQVLICGRRTMRRWGSRSAKTDRGRRPDDKFILDFQKMKGEWKPSRAAPSTSNFGRSRRSFIKARALRRSSSSTLAPASQEEDHQDACDSLARSTRSRKLGLWSATNSKPRSARR